MCANQERQPFIGGNSSTGAAVGGGGCEEEAAASPFGCGCSTLFCGQPWCRRQAAEMMREPPQLLARKKWSDLLRKVGRAFTPAVRRDQKAQFIYDARSYALNFDDGAAAEEDGLLRNFSSRFAAPAAGQQRKAGL
ncbi:unnamed protein product [Cuscuta epithymum]|uniref:Uncharacterized protein n=1 Tax=Cuscuta epithymum TaxID=186058 RepID=A0AAV0FKK7_9ASTE|nr:unnamed protein product [Cuscuta epithymum]